MLVDRKQPSSCRTTALRHFPLSLPTPLSTCLPDLESRPDPSLTSPLMVVPPLPRDSQSTAPPVTDVRAPVSVRICITICLRDSYSSPPPPCACMENGRGRRSESDPPGWSNPNNRLTLNERGPGRRLDVSFSTRHFSVFPGNLIVHVGEVKRAL